MALTWDGCGLVEDSSYLWIHCNHVVALESYLPVPDFNLSIDPVLEKLTHDSVDYVGKISATELLDLITCWKSWLHILITAGKVEDGLDAEALELGHVNVLHPVAVDDALDPHG